MHARRSAQIPPAAGRGPRLWLIAGTGEGPPLAASLLARGWRLRVSVVSAVAARAYAPHDALELAVGALGADGGEASPRVLMDQLQQARRQGDGFRWVVDASHPFAVRITAALMAACRSCDQPLLRLARARPPLGRAELLEDLPELGDRIAGGEPLLLAIGARRLAEAIGCCPTALHHARVLPHPSALRQALAAGVAPARLACLRPGSRDAAILTALCRQWRIRSVLCRQSGGTGEAVWQRLCQELGLRLFLLRRPTEPCGLEALALEPLLARLNRDVDAPDPAARPAAGDRAG